MLKSFLQVGFALCLGILPALAHAQKLEHAVLAYGSTGPNLTPFWVAREAGLHRQYGLDITFDTLMPSAANALPMARACSRPLSERLRCVAQFLRSTRSKSVRD